VYVRFFDYSALEILLCLHSMCMGFKSHHAYIRPKRDGHTLTLQYPSSSLQAELEEAQAALSRKHMQQQVIIDRAEAAERDRDSLTEQLAGTQVELEQVWSHVSCELHKCKPVRVYISPSLSLSPSPYTRCMMWN
jgi:hypothetical protein